MPKATDSSDVPPVVLVERRRTPNRRALWRGGRRNSDWVNRPAGAWRQLETGVAPWRQWLASAAVLWPAAFRWPIHVTSARRNATY